MTCRSPFAFGLRQKLLQDQRVSAQVADRNYLLSNDYFLTDILQTLLFYKSFSVICIYDLSHNVIEEMKLLQHFDFSVACRIFFYSLALCGTRFSSFFTIVLVFPTATVLWTSESCMLCSIGIKRGNLSSKKKKSSWSNFFPSNFALVLKYSVNIAKKNLKDQNNNCSLYSCCASMKRSTV